MTDYIKREDAINTIRNTFTGMTADTLELRINGIPSADVAPVRHGTWKDEFKEDAEAFVKHRYVCTVCGEWQTYGKTQYCSNCGAKMDEGGSNGTDD